MSFNLKNEKYLKMIKNDHVLQALPLKYIYVLVSTNCLKAQWFF